MNARCIGLVVGSVSLSACGSTAAEAPGATVRDSAGVTIVEHVHADSAALSWWSLDPSPVVDIGGAEVEEAYSVHQVRDAVRLSDDRIVVVNGGAADVRYYSADGVHERTSGRRGAGPGEYQRPLRLFALPGDSVLVFDATDSRATILDPAGAYVRDFRLGASGGGIGVTGRLRGGELVGTRTEITRGEITSGFQRPDIAFLRFTPMGEVQDTIVSVPGAERTIHVDGVGGDIRSVMVSASPFSRSTVYAAAGDFVVVATQESPEIRVYGTDGVVRRIVRMGTPMAVVTDEHLDAWFQRNRESMTEERRQQAVTRPDWPDAGKVVPPYGSVAIDDDGNLWVEDYDDRVRTPGTWSVHDPDGRFIARIRMPMRFRVLHAGDDVVLGVELDDLDVEHVRVYRVLRTPASS